MENKEQKKKQIQVGIECHFQEWLGHSNFNTTADVYSHLDYSAKLESASAISKCIEF